MKECCTKNLSSPIFLPSGVSQRICYTCGCSHYEICLEPFQGSIEAQAFGNSERREEIGNPEKTS